MSKFLMFCLFVFVLKHQRTQPGRFRTAFNWTMNILLLPSYGCLPPNLPNHTNQAAAAPAISRFSRLSGTVHPTTRCNQTLSFRFCVASVLEGKDYFQRMIVLVVVMVAYTFPHDKVKVHRKRRISQTTQVFGPDYLNFRDTGTPFQLDMT